MELLSGAFLTLIAFFASFGGAFANTAVYSADPFVPSPPHARVLIGGDMMFDRSIRVASDAKGGDFILECLDPILEKADLVVANLEGPITSNASVSVGSRVNTANNFTFTFPTSTAPLLARHGIRMVNLGNNHIENFRTSGVLSTMAALDAAGVAHFGDPIEQRIAYTTVNHVPLAFVNFNQFAVQSTGALTVEQIRTAKAAGYHVVVYTHWGDEYVPANQYQKNLAHAFIDAGAEMVIGTHPHVIQEHEMYGGKHIYYSLGNLVFDQYWEDAVRRGLMLSVVFSRSGVVSVDEVETYLERDRRTCPVR